MSSYIRPIGQEGRRGGKNEPKVLLSFEFLDIQQGQTLRIWNTKNDLLKLSELGETLNKLTVPQALAQQIIIQYDISETSKWNKNNMPKASKWKYPNTLKQIDVPWSKIKLGGRLRVIGYLEVNIFYVIFLDNNHKFYPSNP